MLRRKRWTPRLAPRYTDRRLPEAAAPRESHRTAQTALRHEGRRRVRSAGLVSIGWLLPRQKPWGAGGAPASCRLPLQPPETAHRGARPRSLVLEGVSVRLARSPWPRRRRWSVEQSSAGRRVLVLLAAVRPDRTLEDAGKRFSLTRLETRTKESNIYASIRVVQTPMRNESEGAPLWGR